MSKSLHVEVQAFRRPSLRGTEDEIIIASSNTSDVVPHSARAEKKLLVKVDWLVLSFCGIMYFVNYLDRANITNAYVSGMKSDLKFVGNDLTKINTTFLVGYILGQIPSNLIIQKISPRYWFSFCVLAWGILTLGCYKVSAVWQFYPIRFFIGVFEASTFAGSQFILGSWYKPDEIAKRAAIFACMGRLGAVCSGVMQGTIHSTMHGVAGLPAWRWLFLIDGIITIPVAFYGFLCFPDTPKNINHRFFSVHERELAIERLPKTPSTKLCMALIKRVLLRWHFWYLSMLWVLTSAVGSVSTNALFALYLQDKNYSIPKRNYYPQGINAIAVLSLLVASVISDKYRSRWHTGIFLAISGTVSGILIWDQRTEGIAFAGFLLSGLPFVSQATFFPWANEICSEDKEERAVVIASMLMLGTSFTSWWSLLFYAADGGPVWRNGMIALIVTSSLLWPYCYLGNWLQQKEQRQRQRFKDSNHVLER